MTEHIARLYRFLYPVLTRHFELRRVSKIGEKIAMYLARMRVPQKCFY